MTTGLATVGERFYNITVPLPNQRNLSRAKVNVSACAMVEMTKEHQQIELPAMQGESIDLRDC
jgi:hypothetical protein